MIRIFGNYYDAHGNKYKVVSFNGDRYACESLRTGKTIFLRANELSVKPPAKPEKVKFTDVIKKEETPDVVEKVEEPVLVKPVISEPAYEEPVYEEPVYEEFYKPDIVAAEKDLKDNIKETADNDFYADF